MPATVPGRPGLLSKKTNKNFGVSLKQDNRDYDSSAVLIYKRMEKSQLAVDIQSKLLLRKLHEVQGELARTCEILNLYAAVVENFPGGIILTDRNLNVVVCNDQQKKLLNYSAELFDNHTPSLYELFQYNAGRGEYGPGHANLLVAEKIELVKKRIPHVFERVRPDGTVVEVRGVPIEGGGFVTTYIDITERRKSEALVYNLAFCDGLTSLSNRVGLNRSFENFAARAQRGEHFALHYIDLDDFKPINDVYGHAMGDLVLQEVANRMRSSCRETDIVARYGGDEFVILQASVENARDIEVLAMRLMTAVQQPFIFEGISVSISCCIGASCSDLFPKSPDLSAMIGTADTEMYHSKKTGKGKYSITALENLERAGKLSQQG
jgi:diguanylate cyclase (GGDEF)-like protein